MESDSETNLVIITRKEKIKLICKLHWRILVIVITPLILMPIIFLGSNNAYPCFYIFLLTSVYWVADVLHPGVTSLVPYAMTSLMSMFVHGFNSQIIVRKELIDCAVVMMFIVALEYSNLHRRVALKLLLTFGCSHYRLSFLLFFTTTFLAMWFSNMMACGLMMPLTLAVLTELEKMGILEVYQTIGKATQRSSRHEQNCPRPTNFTVFYFVGIAYSSTIGWYTWLGNYLGISLINHHLCTLLKSISGGIATLMGSRANQLFKVYSGSLFPRGPKIEFPHFALLNLPGVLVMETSLYLWLNFYFLGMFRAQSHIALEIGITEEETQYVRALLATRYTQLGKITFQEWVVAIVLMLSLVTQAATVTGYFNDPARDHGLQSYFKILSPSIVGVVLLFIIPRKLDFLTMFLRRRSGNVGPNINPSIGTTSKACLNWPLIRSGMHWSVLMLIGGSSAVFESLKDSAMVDEFEKFLLFFKTWPTPALVLVVIVFCKLMTEFASNSCVVYCLLPTIGKLSTQCNVHPHYLMIAATLSCSLPFHLITATPGNAMVCSYVHIPPRLMMSAGVGPSLGAIVVVWFTVVVWSLAIWPDINVYPEWADGNALHG